MAKLQNYNGHYCESEYEYAFLSFLENEGWHYLAGNSIPRNSKRDVLYMDDMEQFLSKINPDLTIITTAAVTGDGLQQIRELITPDSVVTFFGSSGVGKSTIINTLMGKEVLKTSAIREDDARGRHTTTHRQLLYLPDGGIVIDTPGMREFGLDESHVDEAFAEIKELTAQCRFPDCTHTKEPGCKVLEAIAAGTLSRQRFLNYQKLHMEEQRRQGFKKRRNRR